MRSFVFLLATLVLVSSCNFGFDRVKGNGNVTKRDVDVKGFTGIKANGPFDVEITMGDEYKIVVEADDNLQQYVRVKRHGDDLEIRLKDYISVQDYKALKVYVQTPVVKEISLGGSGNVRSAGTIENAKQVEISLGGSGNMMLDLKSPEVNVSLGGSGNVNLTGNTRKMDVSIGGSGDVDAAQLKSEGAEVSIAGSGSVKLFASMSLNVAIAGSGDVYYWGNPHITQSILGSGEVKKGE